jgi:outer membrane protein assembly factor BamB
MNITSRCRRPIAAFASGLRLALVILALSSPWLATALADDDAAKAAAAKAAAAKAAAPAAAEKNAAPEDEKDAAAKQEKAAGGKENGASQPVRNPLTDLIKRGLKKSTAQGNPAGAAMPASDAPPAKKPNRHAADQRAPYDKRADDWMRKAIGHIQAGEWKAALDLLQKISELPEDTLFRTDAGKWVSLRGEAQRLRGDAPADLMEQYRVQFGGLARQLFAEAQRTGDLAGFGRVAATYFHTEAGYDAANRLGSLHLDRGEFALAAHWFAVLWQARASVTRDPLWRAKAAFALKLAGQLELSHEVFDEQAAASASLAGRSHESAKWLAAAPRVAGPGEATLSDWPVFFGTPRRTGVAAGGEPLLLPRWHLAATDSHPVQAQIEHLLEDLADQSSPALPMLFPTMVRGKVVFRTLHGVQVVDAETGKPLWQTDESQPLERLIAGTNSQFEATMNGGVIPGMGMGARAMRIWNNGAFFNGQTGEYSPLANLLFRNANFGIVSSDGQQLFVVDDPMFLTNRQPGNPYGFEGTTGNLPGASGRLACYDLETGRPKWEVGGPANGEPFDLPLAGHFFFGAPVADGEDLFVIGESTAGDTSGQIRLICLDPQSGQKKWTQLIAASEVAVEKDVGRRWWTAQVAAGDGILVCPTTVGWLIAVDRVTHTLLWGYRPPAAAQRPANGFGDNEAAQMVQQTPLGGTWSCAPPIISEGRVVYTPPDAQFLVCLDQLTGKELWNKPRGSGLYLAGVFDRQVVVVGRDAVTAFHLESGAQAWTAAVSPPSGRGVTVASRLYLPLAAGEVWSIDLRTGTVENRWSLPGEVSSIGNLAMYRGMLLSLDVSGLTAFEQRDAVQTEIAARKQQNPRDAWALIRDAQISILSRNLAEALSSLRQVPRDEIPAELRETFRELLVRVLTGTVRSDFARPQTDADLSDLAEAVRTADEKQQLQRLRAELFVARARYEEAFQAYLSLADASSALIPRDESPGVRVRSDLWVAGKLDDLQRSVPREARESLDRLVAGLRRRSESSDAARLRFVTLFRNHPDADAMRRQLAESHATRREFLPAEHHLLKLARSENPAVAAEALERLARLMLDFKLPADAAFYYLELERRFAAVPVRGEQTAAQLVQALRDSGTFPDAPPPVLDWHADALRVERLGANYANYVPQELSSIGSRVPFFATHRFEIEHATQRLDVIDGLTDELHWSLPLRNKAGSSEGGFAFAQGAAHRLTLMHRGVIHSISPVDRRVLWTRPLEGRGATQQYYGRNQTPLVNMQPAANLAGRPPVFQGMQVAPGAGLGLASDDFISYQGRRSMTVLDALTGEVCWIYTGIRPGTATLGGAEVVYLRPPDNHNALALRASDGRQLAVKDLSQTVGRALHVVRDSFVLSGLADGKTGLRLFDPIAGKDLWTVPLDKTAVMSLLENDQMAVLEISGAKFSVVDLRTGARRDMALSGVDDLKPGREIYAFADNLSVYLVVNKGQHQNYYSEQVPFVRTSGVLIAFDAATGRQRWKQPVQGQNLMLERLTFSPFLVFASRKYEQKGRLNFWSLHLLAIDKLTGAKLLDEKSAAQPGFRSVNVNASDRYVELRSFNERVRLYPVEKSASAGQSGG